jgi:hypothetical protein
MKSFIFTVAMMEQNGDQTVGWIGVHRSDGEWCVSWYEANQADEEAAAREEGVFIYRGEALRQAKESCLEYIRNKENQGYRLAFPIRIGEGNQRAGSSLTEFDYYSEIHYDNECYEQLRQWRFKTAQDKKVSPFIVATNRLLKQLSTFLPHNEQEAVQLHGFSTNKWNQYGSDIVEIISKYDRLHAFPLDWVHHQVVIDDFENWKEEQTLAKQQKNKDFQDQWKREKTALLEGIQKGLSLEQVSGNSNQPISTVLKRMERLQEEGYEVLPWLEKEVETIADLSNLIAAAQELGTTYAKPVFLRLYENSPNNEARLKYDQIRTVFTYLKAIKIENEAQRHMKNASNL